MIGSYDSRPSSGETIRQFVNKKMKVTSPGGRNFVHVRDVAEATVSALEKGKTGEVYILGGENLSFLEFFSKVAKITGRKPPDWIVPKSMLRTGGFLGSMYEKLSKERTILNKIIAVCSCVQAYYSSEKAESELGMKHTPIESAIKDSIRSLKMYGYLTR
jgi:dihydroflavonol-4-reductase